MPEGTEKGQNFLTQSFLKNQAFANKGSDLGALNQTMNTFSTKNIRALNSLTNQMSTLNQNIVKMSKPAQTKKDFVRRDDPTQKLIGQVDDLIGHVNDLEDLMRESIKLDKEKKKGKGLLGMLGMAGAGLGGAGLLGYFLTGDESLLNNVVKSVVKYLPTSLFFKIFDKGLKWVGKQAFKLFKPVFGWFGKGLSWVGKKIAGGMSKFLKPISMKFTKFLKPFGMIGKEVGEKVLKSASKFLKPLTKVFRGFTNLWKPLAKVLKIGGKSAGKGVAKGAAKLGLKALKGIPVIGTLIGTYFAFQRWKKGDKAGAMMELASGLLSNIPFAAYAVDAFLLMRDLVGKEKVDSIVGGAAKKVGGALGKLGMAALRHTPGIGTIMRFKDGLDLWKTDKIGALIELGGAISTLVPGGSSIFDSVISIAKMFKKSGNAAKVADEAKEFIGKAKEHPILATKELFTKASNKAKSMFSGSSQVDATTGAGVSVDPDAGKPNQGSGIVNFAGSVFDWLMDARGFPPTIQKSDMGVDIGGLKPSIKEKLFGLSKKFYQETGQKLIVTSGKRSDAKQKQLYDAHKAGKTPYIVAPPGHSKHNKGEAVDISSSQANLAASKGWLGQFGLHQPLPSTDPVHLIEKGDGIGNLPTQVIGSKVAQSNGIPKIALDDSTIQALAQSMGASFKGAMPRAQQPVVNIDNSMRC